MENQRQSIASLQKEDTTEKPSGVGGGVDPVMKAKLRAFYEKAGVKSKTDAYLEEALTLWKGREDELFSVLEKKLDRMKREKIKTERTSRAGSSQAQSPQPTPSQASLDPAASRAKLKQYPNKVGDPKSGADANGDDDDASPGGALEVVNTEGGPRSNNSNSKSIGTEAPRGFRRWVPQRLTQLLRQIVVLGKIFAKTLEESWPWSDGKGVYRGEWKNGVCHGQGTYTSFDGDVYEGEWKDDKRHGQGTSTLSDGRVYEGEWREGRGHGQGTETSSDGKGYYKGEWKDGRRHGQGTFTLPDGSVYEGEWEDGHCNGQGTSTWSDGNLYEGEWKDSMCHGQGTHTWPDGAMYRGSYQKNVHHGPGQYTSTKRQGDTIPINAIMGKFSIDGKPLLLDVFQENLEGAFELMP